MNLFNPPVRVTMARHRWLYLCCVSVLFCTLTNVRINGQRNAIRVTPDGQLVLLTRREILQRRVMQTKKKLHDDTRLISIPRHVEDVRTSACRRTHKEPTSSGYL